jgi:hypothetical protein
MNAKSMPLKRKNIFLTLVLCFALGMAVHPSASHSFGIPSVSLCMEKTGLSEGECQEKMKSFGSMSTEQKMEMKNTLTEDKSKNKTDAVGLENSAIKTPNDAPVIKAKFEKVQGIRRDKKEQFSQAIEKIEKIIELLKSRNVDVAAIEKNMNLFKEKSSSLTGAYDGYSKMLEDGKCSESLTACSMELKKERIRISELTSELVNFYHETLRESLSSEIMKAQTDN